MVRELARVTARHGGRRLRAQRGHATGPAQARRQRRPGGEKRALGDQRARAHRCWAYRRPPSARAGLVERRVEQAEGYG